MKTWLVTGGAGFIGSNFVMMNLKQGDIRIINLDKLTYAGNLETLAPVIDNANHVFIRGDIRDRTLVTETLNLYQPCAVMHLAAETHVDRSINKPDEFINSNILGTFELLEAVRTYWGKLKGKMAKNFRFLHISTDEVYGSLGAEGLFTEKSAYAPRSPYSASKAASDHLVQSYYHTYGLPTLITNCSNNYGPHQFPEKLVPVIILNCIKGKPLPIYGDGQNIRDWLFVEDHCRAIRTVLEHGAPGESYNIGGNHEKTNIDLVHTICDMLDELQPAKDGRSHREKIVFIGDRPGHDKRYAIDFTKINLELGWAPTTAFKTGLRKTIRWYLNNLEWCKFVKATR